MNEYNRHSECIKHNEPQMVQESKTQINRVSGGNKRIHKNELPNLLINTKLKTTILPLLTIR